MTVCYSHVIYGPTVDIVDGTGLPNPLTNVIIPYTGKPKLVIRPVRGEDGFSVKYYEYELSVSAIIYSAVTAVADIEDEAMRIKKILSTPGLKLKMYPVGISTTPVVNGAVGILGTDFTPDLTFGPHPQETTVTPLVTNQAISIEWTVITNISHCSSVYVQNLLQFTSELDVDIDNEGNLTFVQKAIYEASQRIPDLSAFNATMNTFARQAGASFQGMYQTKSTHLSMDGRTATFEARYTEIPSDSAFHPFTRNIDLTDDMSSDLMGGGFYKWSRKFTATITLPARIHKGWAWTVFKKILAERLRNLQQLDKKKAKDALKPANQNNDNNGAKNWYLCIKMKITNKVYTRSMSFDFEYLMCTSLDKLLSRSLICSRVNTGFKANPANGNAQEVTTPVTLSDQWFIWDNTFTSTLTGDPAYKTSVPILYSQCATSSIPTVPQAPFIFGQQVLPLESDPDLDPEVAAKTSPGEATSGQTVYQNEPVAAVDPNYSWIDYDNGFEILQTNDNMQASYLQAMPNNYYQNNSPESGPTRSTVGFQIDNNTSTGDETGYTRPETISRGISTFKIRMKGYAIRAGSTIPIPVLTSVGGAAVERTDTARISQKQIAQSDSTPVYLAMWDITYNVNSNIRAEDIMANIKSTGHPGYYS